MRTYVEVDGKNAFCGESPRWLFEEGDIQGEKCYTILPSSGLNAYNNKII